MDVLALAERAEVEEKRREEEESHTIDLVMEKEVVNILVVEEEVNYPLVPFLLAANSCNSCSKAFSSKNKLNKHIVEMHKDPMSCTLCFKTFSSKKIFLRHSWVHLPPTFTC